MRLFNIRLFVFILFLIFTLPSNSQEVAHPGSKHISSIFWTWQDNVIENPDTLRKNIVDMKDAGFQGLYAMPRATRYHMYHQEMMDAVTVASKECQKQNIEFIWGLDPRFLSSYSLQKTGYGAEMLMVNSDFNLKIPERDGVPENPLLNESKLEKGSFSLRYNYPQRRDVHMLTEAGLWLNPIGMDKVIAYRKKNGKVDKSSIVDITDQSKSIINRSMYYVEVFGKPDLPEGDWYVLAFPRFGTNMYAFDSPEHEKIIFDLLDDYKEQEVHFDGFWWDEPGYYFGFGQYPISDRIYKDFKQKYGYDLKENLAALLLEFDDDSQFQVRYDYFELLMDYVFGGQQRFWQKAEELFGPVRMGVHHTWHTLPDNMYAGCADYWRGLVGVDGGYTDDGAFERYFTQDLAGKYGQIAYMLLASSLAKYAKNQTANYNRWGVNYTSEVPVYWNDLMSLFSNEWIQHVYGYTGILGASRGFGPGFPNHETWPLLPELIKKTNNVREITKYKLPLADVAIVYPITTFLGSREPHNTHMVNHIDRLLGIMPALGIQADGISDWLLAEGKVENGKLKIRNEEYSAVLLPFAKIVTPECLAVIEKLKQAHIPCYFIDEIPQLLLNGETLKSNDDVAFSIGEDMSVLASDIEKLQLPSPVTKLEGAYVTVVPGENENNFVMIMPVVPNSQVGGVIKCNGQKVTVKPTKSLAIYQVGIKGVKQIF
ncbi:hypothetical protein J0X14_06685 [Muricauda sp. CAU 1633]|uniref:hypothetical protein n=1 Tax=Allomuricauda sp. CAU 1633 TaxID=2816036 RepID=UPI001A90562C|nr:hypothetical protein [Muricauda sp. CAU 1633]MBO0321975.1 hypothetical protein [Muricauda sp. CAU 1633]